MRITSGCSLLIWALLAIVHLQVAEASGPDQAHPFVGKWIVLSSGDTNGIVGDALGCTLEIRKDDVTIVGRNSRPIRTRFRVTKLQQDADTTILHIMNSELGVSAKVRLAKRGEKVAMVMNASDKGLENCATPTFEKGKSDQSFQLQQIHDTDLFAPENPK